MPVRISLGLSMPRELPAPWDLPAQFARVPEILRLAVGLTRWEPQCSLRRLAGLIEPDQRHCLLSVASSASTERSAQGVEAQGFAAQTLLPPRIPRRPS